MKAALIIFISLQNILVMAQAQGIIIGTVKESGNPLEFANVFLRLKNDTTKIINRSFVDKDQRYSNEIRKLIFQSGH